METFICSIFNILYTFHTIITILILCLTLLLCHFILEWIMVPYLKLYAHILSVVSRVIALIIHYTYLLANYESHTIDA